jgi:steroid 5-alpha reductase family enzyme
MKTQARISIFAENYPANFFIMKILPIAILLGITLLAVPVFTYFFGTALGPGEWKALNTLIIILLAVMAYCFIAGELSRNNSQVDKLWSVLPVIYTWIVAAYGDFSPRLVLMAVLVSVWGIRLTYNFALKGAYQWKFWAGEEDYRWIVLRQKPEFRPAWKWTLFNLFFISGYQNVLILLFTLPTIVALQNNNTSLGPLDFTAAVLMLGMILLETAADRQQWKFQTEKHRRIKAGEPLTGDYAKGFLDKGLWSLSRHPNYFAEQAIWVCFYLFSVAASSLWINWSIAGCLLLLVLFQGSSAFSEEISAGKYPGYTSYQKTVPRFFPVGKKLFR